MPYLGPGFGLGKGPLIDGDYSLTKNAKAKPDNPENGNQGGNGSTIDNRKRLPIAISIPGNIITEDQYGQESQIIEELFEDLSLFELMEMGRSETVLGQNVVYQPIKNISDIYFTYSPKKILALSGTFTQKEDSSTVRLGQFFVDGAIVLDKTTGDIVVAADNVKDGFFIEIELLSGGEILDS